MTVKSQDDLNKPETHSTEVLLSTIEKLEKTKKQLEIALETLKDTERKLLTIDVSNLSSWDRDKLYNIMFHDGVIDKALDKIEELEK